jgi:hypothetical protein
MEIQQYSDLAGEQAACGDIWMIQLWIGTKNRKTTLNDFGESLISYGSIADLFVFFCFSVLSGAHFLVCCILELKYLICSILELKSVICYLQHFEPKIANLEGIYNVLDFESLVGGKFAASWSRHCTIAFASRLP